MAQHDFGPVPLGMLIDQRLEPDEISLIDMCCLAMFLAIANDWGLLDGSIRGLARRFGKPREEVEEVVRRLSRPEHKLVEFYTVQASDGLTYHVCEVVGFHAYQGHAKTRSDPYQRRASEWPMRNGEFPAARSHKPAPRPVDDGPPDDYPHPADEGFGAGNVPPRGRVSANRNDKRERPQSDKRAPRSAATPKRGKPEGVNGSPAMPKTHRSDSRQYDQGTGGAERGQTTGRAGAEVGQERGEERRLDQVVLASSKHDTLRNEGLRTPLEGAPPARAENAEMSSLTKDDIRARLSRIGKAPHANPEIPIPARDSLKPAAMPSAEHEAAAVRFIAECLRRRPTDSPTVLRHTVSLMAGLPRFVDAVADALAPDWPGWEGGDPVLALEQGAVKP